MDDKLREALIAKAKELEWTWREYQNGNVGLENWSPAGEDLLVDLAGKNVVREMRKYADDFDADDHAEMWLESRGQNGVPKSIRTLIDDADEIQKMMDDLADAFENVEKEWQEELKSECDNLCSECPIWDVCEMSTYDGEDEVEEDDDDE